MFFFHLSYLFNFVLTQLNAPILTNISPSRTQTSSLISIGQHITSKNCKNQLIWTSKFPFIMFNSLSVGSLISPDFIVSSRHKIRVEYLQFSPGCSRSSEKCPSIKFPLFIGFMVSWWLAMFDPI